MRPGKVVYSNGWKSRSGKADQPPDREPWAGGVILKVKHRGTKTAGRKRKLNGLSLERAENGKGDTVRSVEATMM